MKKCASCQREVDEYANVCPYCGGGELIEQSTESQPVFGEAETPAAITKPVREDRIPGIVGALLFGLIGGVLYFIIYQIGIIAGISGLVIFLLANFGYSKFSGIGKNPSIFGAVVSVIVMIVVIFLAEFTCVAYTIYDVYKTDYSITFFDALKSTPEFLKDSEVAAAVGEDLAFAYVFGIATSIANIVSAAKGNKKK